MRCPSLTLCLFLACLAASPSARAQEFDASVPDASVGQGGAERGEEGEGASTTCLADRDCDRGFRCRDRTCVWQRTRDAEFTGCAAAGLSLGPAVALLAWRRRPQRAGAARSKRTK